MGDVSEPKYQDRPPEVHRRLLVRSLLRAGLLTLLLLVAYYLLPLDRPLDGSSVVVLVVGLAVFGVVLGWQVRSIVGSKTPRLRAIEVLITALPLFLLVFAAVYYTMAHGSPSSFSEPLTRTDALYLTVTIFSTVGFGDITPTVESARIIVMIQMLGDLLVLGAGLKLLLGAVQRSEKRRSGASAGDQATQPTQHGGAPAP